MSIELDSVYIYIDETIFKDKYVGVCALETHRPIENDIIIAALDDLKNDPDSIGNKQDHATMERGHFHGSEDSPNAHSHFAKRIKSTTHGVIHFSYIPFQNNLIKETDFRRKTIESFMMTLKSSRPMTIYFERRNGFSKDVFQSQIKKLYMSLDRMAYENPFLPTFYPKIEIVPSGKSNPGIQVVDFLLWTLNWKLYEPTNKKAHWLLRAGAADYCLSEVPIALGLSDRGGRFGWYTINQRLPDDIIKQLEMYPRDIRMDSQSSEETLRYYINTERLIHALADMVIPEHASHFSVPLMNLVRDLKNSEISEHKKVLGVASMFLRLFDTLPVYSEVSKDDYQFEELMRMRKYMGLLFHENLHHSVRTLGAFCQVRHELMKSDAKQLGFS